MNNSPNIEVGILEAEKVRFNLKGKFRLYETGKTCYNRCTAYVAEDRIVIDNEGNEFQTGKKLVFLPSDLNTDYFELEDVVIGIDFHWEKKEIQKFQGALKLKIRGNKIVVINVIPVENYLLSVISSEMNAGSSLELLKAHAIISRSWLMAQIQDSGNAVKDKRGKTGRLDPVNPPERYISWNDKEDHVDFHVCADDHCQRYQGVTRIKEKNVFRAVNETRGEILSFRNEICDARYSKCCGGITERYENCWDSSVKPYLVSVWDGPDQKNSSGLKPMDESSANVFINSSPPAFCNTDNEGTLSQVLNDYDLGTKDFFRWEKTYSQNELASLILKRSGVDFGRIKDIVPQQRSESGRIIELKIVGEKRSMIIGKELVIRKWLSETHLYSSAFIIEKRDIKDGFPSSFRLKGAGWGHGVGLCQIGAAVMGESGYSASEILKHYYRGSEIKKIYN